MSPEVLRRERSLEPDGTELVEEELRSGPGWSALTAEPAVTGDTRYEVLGGRARVRIGTSDRVYRAGESVIVGQGQVASVEPVDGDGVHLLVQRWRRPAAESTDRHGGGAGSPPARPILGEGRTSS